MLTRMLFLIGLVLCGIAALTGAWPASFSRTARDADSAFVPRSMTLDADIIGSGIDARKLLENALGKLDAAEAVWLSTKIRQTVHSADSSFIAEGFLQRGPHQCARLEMKIVSNVGRSLLVIVSDGEILAQVQKIQGIKPIAVVERLPALEPEALEKSQTARAVFLDRKSCGGPAALLRSIHQHLQSGTLQTGLLNDRPVIHLKVDLDPAKIAAFAAMNLNALSASVYLDAKTLWPLRIEWWGAANAGASRSLAQIDFREPIVGVALTDDECASMFSYAPDGSEHVTEAKRRNGR
jgi:hypothetical protein